MKTNLTDSERQHFRLLSILRENTDEDTIFSGDACQLVYTGAFSFNIPNLNIKKDNSIEFSVFFINFFLPFLQENNTLGVIVQLRIFVPMKH